MICPKCGSDKVHIQLQTKRKGTIFSFLIRLVLFLFVFILWLASLLIPGHKTKTNKLAVCQNCGNSWRVTRGSVRTSAKQARIAAIPLTAKPKHDYSRDIQRINDSKFWENEWFGYAMMIFFAPLGVILMYRYNQKITNENKKIVAIIAISIWLILSLVVIISGAETRSESTNTQQPENAPLTQQKVESKKESVPASGQVRDDSAYMDALRKCTVMEAADIYTTGFGAKTDNAFNDGRDACNSIYVSTYASNDKQFASDINSEWTTRKGQIIDSKTLEYYLSVLDW